MLFAGVGAVAAVVVVLAWIHHRTEKAPAEELFAMASPAVVRVVVQDGEFQAIGQGSGFFIWA